LALEPQAAPPGTYRQRGVNSLQGLFRAHFPEFCVRYEAELAKLLGKFRLPRITKAVERFLGCGDYSKGIARIQCTNPDCRAEYFRPFAACNDYFRTDTKVFPAVEFLVEVLQHLPDSRRRLLRTYGLYSSRARGTLGPAAARQRCGRVGA